MGSSAEGTWRNVAVLLVLAWSAVVLAACTSSGPTAARPPGSTSTTRAVPASDSTSTTTPAAPPCMAHQLRVLRASRQGGGFQTAAVIVLIENTASSACVLDQPPYALSLVGTGGSGAALAVAYLPGAAGAARTLGAGAVGEADLNWANWCQGDPGPLVIRFTLRSGGGAVESLMDGPSGVGYVPGCNDPRRPSSITFLEWATEPPG